MNKLLISSKSHIRELDGVRGIAVLMVLVWHYVNSQGAAKLCGPMAYLTKATSEFWSGVDLFFVLSGFLIGGILIDNSAKRGFYRTFYIRRAARILPVYVLLLTLFFICRAGLDDRSFAWLFNDAIPDFAYLSFTQNIFMGQIGNFGGHFLGVTWSLAVEEQFYLMIPVLLAIVGRDRFMPMVIALAVSAPLLRFAVPSFVSFVNMPFRMDALLVGVILAAGFRSETFVQFLSGKKLIVLALFMLLIMGVVLMRALGHGSFLDFSVFAAVYATFITLVLVYRDTSFTAILRSEILVRSGMYSYGLYMYHQMVAGIVHGIFRGSAPSMASAFGLMLTLLSLIITVVLALISFHTYEAFALSIGRRYKYDRQL